MDESLRRLLMDPTARKLAVLAIGLLAIRLVFGWAARVISRRIQDSGLRYRTRKGLRLGAYLAAAVFAAVVFSERFAGFTVAFGVAGAGIAFALQEVIASIGGWLAVSFGDFYRPGDRVQLGGIRGDVIDVGVLRTTIMECGDWVKGDQYNGRIVRVANSFVFKEPVFNYSADFPFLWDEIMLPVKYGSDYHQARALMRKVADEVVGDYARSAETAWRGVVKKFMIEDAVVEPTVMLTANQNWIELTLRYVVDYKRRRIIKDQLYTRILEEVDASGGRVGIAASTLNIEKVAPIEVRIAEDLRGEHSRGGSVDQ